MKPNVRAIIGENIRIRRKELGHTQEGFALYTGLARTYYGRIERGAQNVTIERLIWLAAHLETSVPDLTEGLTQEICLDFVENDAEASD